MTSRQLLTAALLSALLPVPLVAQQPAPQRNTVVVSSWKCAWNRLDRVAKISDSLAKPIAQELVNEGRLINFGMLVHDWADEWNVVFYYTARDKPTFFAAWQEFLSRFSQRHPNAPPLTDFCADHRDNIYAAQFATTPAPSR